LKSAAPCARTRPASVASGADDITTIVMRRFARLQPLCHFTGVKERFRM
jgi:hypothetical protein